MKMFQTIDLCPVYSMYEYVPCTVVITKGGLEKVRENVYMRAGRGWEGGVGGRWGEGGRRGWGGVGRWGWGGM
jgi:hypothetical protein